ncbi:MAG: sensor domain-containing diguanylate cyclase [Sulfuricurvum sp.]|nr:sensor domain-containing diguanylate cyclase [Sulfuricurvum sp.]
MIQWKSYLPHIRSILEKFSEDARNIECFNKKDHSFVELNKKQNEKLIAIFETFGTPQENESVEEFLYFCIHHEIPYLYVTGEISNIVKELLTLLAAEQKYIDISSVNDYFVQIEYRLSCEYYHQFLRKLAVKNHLRLSHLSYLIEKHLMIHYQHHLEWMLVLISELEGTPREGSNCELDHTKCSFGQWLHNPTLPYITNTSHFADIQNLHIVLHGLADTVLQKHKSSKLDHKIMIQLMQRLDYTSLEIGNEIAIINDMLIIGEYTKDPLTGLLGRRLFDKIVMGQIEIAKATESDSSMIMCDLDNFKSINDQFGHLAGDEVIKNFAALLQKTLRKSDFIFRFGGEEFLILLPCTNHYEAFVLAQKLCDLAASEKIPYQNETLSYTVSIGVHGIDTKELSFVTKATIEQYVKIVDSKLYLAKQNGKNRVE